MTYYKYAERNVANQMDWSVVNRDITQTLQEEAKLRERKKADIDAASRQFGKVLNDAPMGENQGVNQWALDYSASAQDAMLSLDRELKSGNMSLRDYTKKRQALLDGTDGAFGLIQEYQTEYKKNVEAYQKGEMSYQGMWQMGLLDGLSNFSETGLYINPTDYSVSVGKKVFNEKTGMYELSTNPNDLSSVNTLRNRLKTITPKFDVDGNLKAGADVLGAEIRVLKSRGVLTLSDITQRKEYTEAENNFIKSQMVDPNNVGSILTDHDKTNKATGQQWDYTRDPEAAKKDPNLILMVPDPANPASGRLVPKLTPEQEKVAEDFLRNRLRTMLDVKETPTPIFQPRPVSESTKAGAENAKKLRDMGNMVGRFYWGTKAEQLPASAYFTGLNPNIKDVVRGDRAVTVFMENGDKVDIPLYDANNKPISQLDFIKSATILTGGEDVTRAMKEGDYRQGATLSKETSKYSKGKVVPRFSDATVTLGKDKLPVSARLPKKTDTINYFISDGNVRKRKEQAVSFLQNFPDKDLLSGLEFIAQTDDDIQAVDVIIPGQTEPYRMKVEKGEAGIESYRNALSELWDILAEMSNSGGVQQTPQQQQQGTTSGAEGDELFND